MHTSFYLPDLGEGLQEAKVVQWHVAADDIVDLDQVVVSVETAKSLIEITAPCKAKIHALSVVAGNTIAVAACLFTYIDLDAPAQASEKQPQRTRKDIDNKKPAVAQTQAWVPAMPMARRMADEYGYSIGDIAKYCGVDKLTVADVERYHATHAVQESNISQVTLPINTALVDSTLQAWQTAVHTVVMDEFDIASWYKQKNINWVLLQAMLATRVEFPKLFARICTKREVFLLEEACHIALPIFRQSHTQIAVLRDVHDMDESSFMAKLDALKQESAVHEDIRDAHTILSNVGAYGGRFATPLCMPPVLSTLAVGRARLRPFVRDGDVVATTLLPVSFAADHRYIDGAELVASMQYLGSFLSSYRV